MKKIAITGGIGTGKSAVGKILLEKGFTVLDSDKIVRDLYERIEVQGKVKEIFSSLKKEEISEQAFSDPEKLAELEAILHPLVKKEIDLVQGKILFVEVPLLFEAGMEKDFDFVAVVKADKEKRIERLKTRGIDEKNAIKRIEAQLSEDEKIKRADLVIDNNRDLENLKKQVEKLIRKVVE